jgi:hypothetical protein
MRAVAIQLLDRLGALSLSKRLDCFVAPLLAMTVQKLRDIRITACPVAAVYDRRTITTPRSTAVIDRRYRKPGCRE